MAPFILPRYRPDFQAPPIDFQAEHSQMQHWQSGESVKAAIQPIGRILLDQALADHLSRCAPSQPSDNPHKIDMEVQPQLDACRHIFDAATTLDVIRSGGQFRKPLPAEQRRKTTVIYRMYEERSNASMLHTDYEEDRGPYHTCLRYAVTLLGPGTEFGDGIFDKSQFDGSGNYLGADRARTTFPVGTVLRFNTLTPHAAPKLQSPSPRLFMSSTFVLNTSSHRG